MRVPNNTKNIRYSDEEWSLAGLLLGEYPGGRSEAARDGIRRAIFEEIARRINAPIDQVDYRAVRDHVFQIREDRVARIRKMQEDLVQVDMVVEHLDILIRRQEDAEYRAQEAELEREKRERELEQIRRLREYRNLRFIERANAVVPLHDRQELASRLQNLRNESLTRGYAYAIDVTESFLLSVWTLIKEKIGEEADVLVQDDREAIDFAGEFLAQ